MSGTRFMSTGQVHGAGVYATDDLQMAYRYGGKGKVHCVAVIELLVDYAPYKKADGIYVIPNEKLLFPRYLFKMSGLPKSDGKEILAFYKKLREGTIKSKTKEKRLARDQCTLLEMDTNVNFLEELTQHCWSITIDSALLRCYVYNYPFTPPILQLVYQTDNPNFDNLGCYKYPLLDWSPQNSVVDVVIHARSKVRFADLEANEEEYPKLEDI